MSQPLVLKFTHWTSSLTVEKSVFTAEILPDKRSLMVLKMLIMELIEKAKIISGAGFQADINFFDQVNHVLSRLKYTIVTLAVSLLVCVLPLVTIKAKSRLKRVLTRHLKKLGAELYFTMMIL
ncbi:hypothetical protein COLO4_36018 [Corchorus olitorius]|uniref:Uncharacterized protein n=1 Tax=Corchorus olitorius TaxID=93759 RepID=A0A1R3GBI2_9ROSI|nr:hypothetical protein COLO4_36018 [Corchorus olitorius]